MKATDKKVALEMRGAHNAMKYCSQCGGPVTLKLPEGDDRLRYVCEACRVIHYQNPKMVVGCIAQWESEILLCRRAITPCIGKWTLPAGYLENGESVQEGARREAYEEAQAVVVELQPFALLNLSFISQIYFMFRGRLPRREFAPGPESLETRLFREQDIPWDDIAFPVIAETLKLFYSDLPRGNFSFHLKDVHQDKNFILC